MKDISLSTDDMPSMKETVSNIGSTSSSFLGFSFNYRIFSIISIIFILAILGLNIFNYLGNITDTFSNMFKSILT